MTNGLSEVTLAQIVLLPKSGAGAPGVRIVRSTNAPPSPWRMRSAENAAASPANDGMLAQTIAPPLNAAVVLTSNAIAPSIEKPAGICDASGGAMEATVVSPAVVTCANTTEVSPDVNRTLSPIGVLAVGTLSFLIVTWTIAEVALKPPLSVATACKS